MPECDVFLSYSWSSDPQGPGENASWARNFQERLAKDLSDKLNRDVQIFLDQTAMPNGRVANSLREQLESARAFVAIVSDPWGQTGSWCPWELAHFRRCAPLHSELPDSRIAKVLLRPVNGQTVLPRVLDDMPAYQFYDQVGRNGGSAYNTFSVADLPSSPEHTRLVNSLKRVLEEAPQPSSSQCRGSVFIGDVPPELEARRDRLCTELRKRNLRPICDSPWPGVSQLDFREEIGQRLSQADASIHLLGPISQAPGWPESVAQMELDKALDIADIPDRRKFTVMIWPSSDPSAPVAEEWSGLLPRARSQSRASVLEGKSWEYTLSNIHDTLRRNLEPGEADPPPPNPVGGKEVFVQCIDDDRATAQMIRASLEDRGHRVRYLPQQRGWAVKKKRSPEDLARHQRYLRYYTDSDGILVLYGKSEEFWATIVCDEIRDHLGQTLRQKIPGLFVAPPEEEKDFRDYDYPNYQFATLPVYEAKLRGEGGV